MKVNPLRAGLALVAASDLAAVAVTLATTAPGPLVPTLTPAALRIFFHHPFPVAIVAAAGLAGLWGFARSGRRSLASGIVGLLAMVVLSEAHAALVGGPMRNYFASGAMLLGWLFGEVCAGRCLKTAGVAEEVRMQISESMAADGARGVLAATYVASGLSKLAASGASWIGPVGLRAVVLCLHPLDDTSILGAYARAIESSGAFATVVCIATLVIELGAVVYPFSAKTRAVWGTLLVLFHLNALVVMHLFYRESVILLALFSYRWGFAKEPTPAPGGDTGVRWIAVLRSFAPWVAGVVVACAVLASRPVKAYTAMHRPSPEDASPGPYRDDLRALLAGLSTGDDLGGFVVLAVGTAAGGGASIDLAQGEARLTLTITRHARLAYSPPAATERYDVYWGRLSPSTFPEDQLRPALVALLERLRRTESVVPIPAGM